MKRTVDLCSDGKLRAKGNVVGYLAKCADGFFFYTFPEFSIMDWEVEILWEQYDNNVEVFS